jgi:hypothetical protein
MGACGVFRGLAFDAQLVQVLLHRATSALILYQVSGLQPNYSALYTKMSTNLSLMHLSHDVWLEGAGQHNLWIELGIVQAVETSNQHSISESVT